MQRLKEYKARLVVLPKKVRARKGDKTKPATQEAQGPVAQATGFILPIVQPTVSQEVRAITAQEKKNRSFVMLRVSRANARLVGKRQKWAEEKAAEEELTSKK